MGIKNTFSKQTIDKTILTQFFNVIQASQNWIFHHHSDYKNIIDLNIGETLLMFILETTLEDK